MNDIGEWIKLLGGLAGLTALAWRIVDEFGSYLRIAVKAEVPKDGWVIRIGDETLTYRAPVDVRQLRAGLPYAVRFFVFPKGRLHRSTHDCFVTERLENAA